LQLTLDQQGTKVTGFVVLPGDQGNVPRAIEGSVGGDVFRFKQVSGNDVAVYAEMTVGGDEMTGVVRSATFPPSQVVLRRISSSRRSPQQE
jgi:hypothetical protein